MPKQTLPLTDSQCKKLEAPQQLSDGGGLYLQARDNGKYWRFRYYRPSDNKRDEMRLGVYPEISLKEAREKREELRGLIAKGIDPKLHQQDEAQRQAEQLKNTFEAIARKWHSDQVAKPNKWKPDHAQRANGVFFASIDDDEQVLLRQITELTYGKQNFINNVIWQKKYSPSNDAKWLSDNHDFIIAFAKNKEIWRPDLLPRSEKTQAMYKNPDNDQRGVWKSGDMSVKTYSPSTDYPIATPSGRIVNPPAGRCWRVSKEKFEELVADNRIWFGETGNNVPSVKRFLSEVKDGVTPLTVWTYEEVGHNQEAKKEMVACFNVGQEVSTELLSKATPKPVRLLSRSVARGTGAEGQGCRRAGRAGQTGRVRCHRPYSPVRGDSQPDAGCRSEGAPDGGTLGNHGAR